MDKADADAVRLLLVAAPEVFANRQIVNIAGPSDRLLPYPQNFGKPTPKAVKTFTHILR